jgi:hypothetical protein
VGPALSPAVHGTRSFFQSILWAHIAGQALGGVALGFSAGVLGLVVSSVGPAATWAVAAVIAVYSAAELLPRQPWRPASTWQVPEHYRRTPYVRSMAFLWGAALGFGWLTMNVTAAFFITFLAMTTVPPEVALVAGAIFGIVRGLTLLLTVGASRFEDVVARFTLVRGLIRPARLVSAAVGVALAVAVASNIG